MRRLLALSLTAGILLTGCTPASESAASNAAAAVDLKHDLQNTSRWMPAKLAKSAEFYLLPDAGPMSESLPAGAHIEYSSDSLENGKRQIRIANELRWIDATVLEPDSGANSSTAAMPNIYAAKAKLNLNSTPHRGSRKVVTLPKNAQVEQRSNPGKGWIKVAYGRTSGWVQAGQLSLRPQHLYQSTEQLRLSVTPRGGKTTVRVPHGAVLKATGRTSGKHLQLVYRNKSGWTHGSHVARAMTVKYKLRGYTPAVSKPGGSTQAYLYKNQIVGAISKVQTKSKGATWVKIRHAGKDLWIPAGKVIKVDKNTRLSEPTKILSKFQTTTSTPLRKSPNGQTVQTLAKRFVLGSPTSEKVRAGGKTWLHVMHKSKHYWIDASTVKNVHSRTKLGPSAAPSTGAGRDLKSLTRTNWTDADYIAAIKKNISPWCPSVPVKLTPSAGSYYATSHPLQITMSRVDNPNPNWGNILSVSLHECAHILQFTVYKNRLDDLDRDMDPLWGKKGMGAEYLADCMSDLMGGKRSGTLPNGWTYWSGYGQGCSSAQKAAAQKLLRGSPLSPSGS